MRFSDRIGITKPPTVLLMDRISVALRNSLWNYLLKTLFRGKSESYKGAVEIIAERFFKFPVDSLPSHGFQRRDWLRKYFFADDTPWYQVYNLLEFIVTNGSSLRYFMKPEGTVPEINRILEREMSGYRFVGASLAPISNSDEVAAVTAALDRSSALALGGVQAHLQSAVALMSRKPSPDYRNSVKESISSIESLVKRITGTSSGGLDKALSFLDAKVKFHGAFKAGILSLYGYTSDDDGIRHAILDEPTVGFDEAKFMLVTCSALTNFMISKALKHGIIKDQ